MPDIDLETLVLGLLVIGGQTIAFAVRPATPMVRILAAGAGVIVFLVMPIGWAIAAGMALIAVVLLLDPKVPDRDAMANLLLLGGFLAMIPVVYAILWISQHSVGREATLPALFGSAFVVFALFLGSRARLLSSALLGASGGLLVAGILAAIFWRPVD